MAHTIAFFNNKGGVSKTTTCFNVGWMLAERGHTVVMVDGDPQCNLTGMVLDVTEEDALAKFYEENPKRNLKEALEPAFASRPKPLEPVECVEVEGRENLYLIPGHVGLAEDEVSLGIAQQLSESVQALKNLPGSFKYLFDITAEQYDAEFVLLDLSPGAGLNKSKPRNDGGLLRGASEPGRVLRYGDGVPFPRSSAVGHLGTKCIAA